MTQIANQGFKTYARLLKASRTYWAIFLIGALSTLLMSSVDAGFTWLIKPIINKGFIARDTLFIHWLPLIVILIFIFRGFAGFASNYFIYRVARNVVMDFRRAIFTHLLRLPASFYDQNSSGHLLSTIVYNVEQVAEASSDALVTLLREGTLLIGLIAVMFVVDWKLSLLFLIIAPLIAWVIKRCSSRLRRLSTSVQESMGEVTHVASEGIDAYKVIRLFGGETYENQKFNQATLANRQREMKVIVTNSVGTSLVQILVAVPIAVVLFFATTPELGVTAGSFAAIVAAMIALLRPMRRITMVNSYIQKGVAAAESIFSLLDESLESDTGALELDRSRGEIEYRDVNFHYDAGKGAVLRNINFKIESGKTVALVGHSGSGKSTLINLLPRFYDVTSGEVMIDGVNVADYQLSDLRHQFAFVSQQSVLFNDTIARNIAYACDNPDEKDIIAAAKSAHAMEFIETLPNGLNTVVGENGVLLSGGQRQRLAIARALFKRAPILILDEATASLDTVAERHIQSALETLMEQCTTLVIAHRLSTIEKADWIIVLDQGEIVETGTHDSLLKLNGAYAHLHRMQFQDGAAT